MNIPRDVEPSKAEKYLILQIAFYKKFLKSHNINYKNWNC